MLRGGPPIVRLEAAAERAQPRRRVERRPTGVTGPQCSTTAAPGALRRAPAVVGSGGSHRGADTAVSAGQGGQRPLVLQVLRGRLVLLDERLPVAVQRPCACVVLRSALKAPDARTTCKARSTCRSARSWAGQLGFTRCAYTVEHRCMPRQVLLGRMTRWLQPRH